MNSRSHGIFWVVIQITLLTTWAVLLLAGERYVPNDTLRTTMDAAGLALMAAGLLLAVFSAFNHNKKPDPPPESDSKQAAGKAPYAIYGGIILMVIGATLFFPTLTGALFVPVLIAFFYIRLRSR